MVLGGQNDCASCSPGTCCVAVWCQGEVSTSAEAADLGWVNVRASPATDAKSRQNRANRKKGQANPYSLSVDCFVKFSRTQLSPSISSGPTKQPEDSSTSGPVTKPPMQFGLTLLSLPLQTWWRATINGKGVRCVSRSSAPPIANRPVQMHLRCCHLPPRTDPTLKPASVVYIPCPPPPRCTSHR